MKLRSMLPAGTVAGVLAATCAFASTPAVMSHVSVYMIAQDGHIEPLHGAPFRGETIEYRATYTNLSHGSVNNLHATLRVPTNLFLIKVLNSPVPSTSVDGLRFHKLVLRSAEVASTGYPVVFGHGRSYRFLRWNLSHLTPGMTRVVFAVFTVGR